jgi:4-hydroxy-3-methylbut-2-enyl diphosphate reductase
MATPSKKTLYLATPRGFCAGVDRAILVVKRALEKFGAPVYVHHEIVHNRFVIANLQKNGAIFIEQLDEAPDQYPLIFSAHGVSRTIERAAYLKKQQVLDATCPLVKKIHLEVRRLQKAGFEIIMIGHAGHPEVKGTMGQSDNGGIYLVESLQDVVSLKVSDPQKLAYVTQTTLSVYETDSIIKTLIKKFPHIVGPRKSDICYATKNRQNAAMNLAKCCDIVIIVGSPNSSNSNRLKEIINQLGTPAWMVDHGDQIEANWFVHAKTIGLAAGASTPEHLVQTVLSRIQQLYPIIVKELPGIKENIIFALPDTLR